MNKFINNDKISIFLLKIYFKWISFCSNWYFYWWILLWKYFFGFYY